MEAKAGFEPSVPYQFALRGRYYEVFEVLVLDTVATKTLIL